LNFLTQYYSNIKTDQVRPEPGYRVNEYADGKLNNVADKHLNPKFAGMAGKVDRLEETEARLNAERTRQWDNRNLPYLNTEPRSADRSMFAFIWLVIIALALGFAYFKYRQNRSKFWKAFYYRYNDYKLLAGRLSV